MSEQPSVGPSKGTTSPRCRTFKGVFIREDRKKPVIIPEEDFMEMVKALRKPELVLKYRSADWWRMFLYAAYYLGLRRGEILGLAWGHVSLETLEVHVLSSNVEVPQGKSGSDISRYCRTVS